MNNFTEQIGVVIKIPDDKTIIIQTPKENIKRGDNLAIYDKLSEIKDLDGKLLGHYGNIKETVEVVENQKTYVIAKKVTRLQQKISNPFDKPFITYSTMDVNSKDNENLSLKTEPIKIGDPVKKI